MTKKKPKTADAESRSRKARAAKLRAAAKPRPSIGQEMAADRWAEHISALQPSSPEREAKLKAARIRIAIAMGADQRTAEKLAGAERLRAARIRMAYKVEAAYQQQPGHRRYWISWYESGGFELLAPWWSSGWRLSDDASTICAAILAPNEEAARQRIREARSSAAEPEWRFCNERAADWSPFDGRFQREAWMLWVPS